MNRPEKTISRQTNPTRADWTKLVGLAGMITSGIVGCQVIGGLEDLKLANDVDGGMGGNGGNDTNGSSSVSSSSGSA